MNYRFINMEYLDSVSGGDIEIIKEIVGIFTEQSAEIYNEMVTLNAMGKFNELGLLAHKAKSSVAIMGMNELANMLKLFEQQAKEGTHSHLFESYLTRFKEETTEAVKELEHIINNR